VIKNTRVVFCSLLMAMVFYSVFSFSQNNPQAQTVFINSENQQSIDNWDIKSPSFEFHSSFKPYLISTLDNYSDTAVKFLHYPIKNYF